MKLDQFVTLKKILDGITEAQRYYERKVLT